MGAAGFSFHMTVIPAPEFLSCPRPTSLALVGLPCLFLLVVPRRSEEGSVAGEREKQRKHILGQACPVLLVIAVLPHLLFGGASLRNLLESILCRIDLMMIGQLRIIFTPLFLCSLVRLLVRPEMHWRSTLPKKGSQRGDCSPFAPHPLIANQRPHPSDARHLVQIVLHLRLYGASIFSPREVGLRL